MKSFFNFCILSCEDLVACFVARTSSKTFENLLDAGFWWRCDEKHRKISACKDTEIEGWQNRCKIESTSWAKPARVVLTPGVVGKVRSSPLLRCVPKMAIAMYLHAHAKIFGIRRSSTILSPPHVNKPCKTPM